METRNLRRPRSISLRTRIRGSNETVIRQGACDGQIYRPQSSQRIPQDSEGIRGPGPIRNVLRTVRERRARGVERTFRHGPNCSELSWVQLRRWRLRRPCASRREHAGVPNCSKLFRTLRNSSSFSEVPRPSGHGCCWFLFSNSSRKNKKSTSAIVTYIRT